MPAFNRLHFLKGLALVLDSPAVPAAYAAAFGKQESVVNAPLQQMVAGETNTLNLHMEGLHWLRQMAILELCASTGGIDFEVEELRDLVRLLHIMDKPGLFDLVRSSEGNDWKGLCDSFVLEGLPSSGVAAKKDAATMLMRACAGRL